MEDSNGKSMQDLYAAIIDYYLEMYPDLSETASSRFFDYVEPRDGLTDEEFERIVGLMNEWFVFDFKLPSDLTPLQEYLRDNPESLDEVDLSRLEEADSTNFSTDFWLLDAKTDEGILVLEPFHEAIEYQVADRLASKEMAGLRGAIGLRLVRIDNQWQPAGTGIYFAQTNPTQELKDMVRESDEVEPLPFIDLVKENYGPNSDVSNSNNGTAGYGQTETNPELVRMEYEAICAKTGVKVPWQTLSTAVYEATPDDSPYHMFKEIFAEGLPDRATFFTLFDILIRAWNVLPKRMDGKL